MYIVQKPKPMTVRNFVETLDHCKSAREYTMGAPKPDQPVKRPINWDSRNAEKLKIFINTLKWLGFAVLVSAALAGLGYSLDAELGDSFGCSIVPMLLLTLAWIVPSWKFFDKGNLLMMTTLGAIPIHMLMVAGLSYVVVTYVENVNVITYFISMIMNWVLFFIPEVIMMTKMQKLERTAEIEP